MALAEHCFVAMLCFATSTTIRRKMATPELRALVRKYSAAFATYKKHAQALNDAFNRGELPSIEALEQEGEALEALTSARERLLRAMSGQ